MKRGTIALRAVALSAVLTASGPEAAAASAGARVGAPAPSSPAAPEGILAAFRATGVLDRDAAATVVHCTNLGPAASTVFVDVYNFGGVLDCSEGFAVAPDETRTFATRNVAAYIEDATCDAPPVIAQGSLVVALSAPTPLACTVQLVDPVGASPTFLDTLSLYDGNGLYLGFAIFEDGFESGDTSAWDQTLP